MAGSLKYFVYTSDGGERYAVKLDESNAELTNSGFEDLLETDTSVLPMPKGMRMRYVNTKNAATGAARKIYCGKADAGLYVSGGVVLLSLIATASGLGALLPFSLTSAIGEFISRVNPADTGLLDGDQDAP